MHATRSRDRGRSHCSDAPAIGPEAAAVAGKKMGMDSMTVDIKILQLLAREPLVATSRIDITRVAGKPSRAFKVRGRRHHQGWQDQEYCDYIFPDGHNPSRARVGSTVSPGTGSRLPDVIGSNRPYLQALAILLARFLHADGTGGLHRAMSTI
jgi:hypothetical protein